MSTVYRNPIANSRTEATPLAARVVQTVTGGFEGARGVAAMLLAALVATLMVVANQVIDSWTDGHLLLAWMALWMVGFAALALFATPMANAAMQLRSRLHAWKLHNQRAREDAKLWNVALSDARVMAEITRAMTAEAAEDVRGFH